MNELKQSQSRRVLPIISVVTFLGFLDTHLLIPVISLYAVELGAGAGIAGLIVGLYSITNTPANILFGRLVDRVGYKLPLIAGLIGDAFSMFLYSVCRLPVHLALVRVLHGIGGGLVGPATMSVTADYSARVQKGRTMSIYGMSIAAATLVGYGLGTLLPSREVIFLFGAVMLAIGAGISLLSPAAGKRTGVTTETSPDVGLNKVKDLLKRRGLIVAYCSIFAQYFTFGGVVTLLPIYVNNLGMERFDFGMLMVTFAVMFIIIQFPSGALSDKVGRLVPTFGGLSIGIVSLLALSSVTTFPLLAAVMALYGIGYGLLFPSISALVADHSLPEERGMATGIFHALLTAGVAIGAPVMGWIGEGVGINLGLMSTPVIMVLALAVALIASRRI